MLQGGTRMKTMTVLARIALWAAPASLLATGCSDGGASGDSDSETPSTPETIAVTTSACINGVPLSYDAITTRTVIAESSKPPAAGPAGTIFYDHAYATPTNPKGAKILRVTDSHTRPDMSGIPFRSSASSEAN